MHKHTADLQELPVMNNPNSSELPNYMPYINKIRIRLLPKWVQALDQLFRSYAPQLKATGFITACGKSFHHFNHSLASVLWISIDQWKFI